MDRHRSTRHSAAFTLIELLVAVGLIAVLLGILLPAVGRVRDAAAASACASNLRQIVMAWTQYAHDHRGRLLSAMTSGPAAWVNHGTPETPEHLQAGALWGYLQTVNVYRCPADPRVGYLRS